MRFHSNARFGSRPSYGGDSTRRPGGYELAGYGYGNGGYGSGRPSGYWGPAASGGYGTSGTLVNGDEFGPMEPSFPEGGAPPHPNIQTQKVIVSYTMICLVDCWILSDKIVSLGCSFESVGRCRFDRGCRRFGYESCSTADRNCVGKEETIESIY